MSRPDNAFFRLFSKTKDVSLVETGTQHGKGLREFIACGFKNIHSIEAYKQYFDNCSRVFERDIKAGLITLHFGPSETELAKVIASIPGPIVYWLDAHFQGTEIDAKHCPLDDEVKAILGRGIKADDIILIDDIRLVVQQRAWRGHDVDFNQIVGQLIVTAPNHFCCFVRGHVANDVFCLVPKTMASDFFDLVKALGATEQQDQTPLVA